MARARWIILLGILASFLIPSPIHALTTTPQRIYFASNNSGILLQIGNGPAFSHCGASAPCAIGEVFTATNPNAATGKLILDNIVFNLAEAGLAPSGNLRAELFPTVANAPTGTTGLATSANIPIQTAAIGGTSCGSTGNNAKFVFSGSNQYPLVIGTTYAAVLESFNTTNYSGGTTVQVCGNSSGPNTAYNYLTGWTLNGGQDYLEVWADPPSAQNILNNGNVTFSQILPLVAASMGGATLIFLGGYAIRHEDHKKEAHKYLQIALTLGVAAIVLVVGALLVTAIGGLTG